jgi:hypothetical protein
MLDSCVLGAKFFMRLKVRRVIKDQLPFILIWAGVEINGRRPPYRDFVICVR